MVGYKKQSRTLLVLALSLLLGAQTCMPIIPQSWDAMIDHVCDKAWEFKGSTAILTGLATIAYYRCKKLMTKRTQFAQLKTTASQVQQAKTAILAKYNNSQKELNDAFANSNNARAQAQADVNAIDRELQKLPKVELTQDDINKIGADSVTAQQHVDTLNAELKAAQDESARLQLLIQQNQSQYAHTLEAFKKYMTENGIMPDTLTSEDTFIKELFEQKEAARTPAAAINTAVLSHGATPDNAITTINKCKQQLYSVQQKLNAYLIRTEQNFSSIIENYYASVGKNLFDELNLDSNCAPWITPRLIANLQPQFTPEKLNLVNQLFSHAVYKENYLVWAIGAQVSNTPTNKSNEFNKKLEQFAIYLESILQKIGSKR